MTFIKICGITNESDAVSAAEAGADALGFNFYPPSSRYIEPEKARRIIEKLPPNVLTVGVFVNEETPQAVLRIASQAGVTAVQLHGDESPEYCQALGERFVIKVLRTVAGFEPAIASRYKVEAVMLDAFDNDLRGGTGRVVDWTIAREVRALVPKLILAGGLSPRNIASAIAAVGPYGVDACSALESKPGEKDLDSVRAFIQAARLTV